MVSAYLMEPLASRLARRMPRGLAAVLAILCFTLLVGLFLWAMVPPFVAQVERLVGSLPAWQARAIARWLPWLNAHPAVLDKLQHGLDGLERRGRALAQTLRADASRGRRRDARARRQAA